MQFGTGNFLRGFADWMIQRANDTLHLNMGVSVIQSVSKDSTLQDQNGEYTVIMRGLIDGRFVSLYERISVIQRIVQINQYEQYLAEADNPDLELIISNTTEAGIVFNPSDVSHSVPAHSFPGKLTQLLYKRYKVFPDKKLGVIPCELIERNGEVLNRCILQYANQWNLEPAFLNYLKNQVFFCNTLVDRIVPGFPKDAESYWKELGYTDHALTVGEHYHLWVMEANPWVQEHFPLDRAGLNVIYTSDLEPYRVRKVRILNGIHTAMAFTGLLAGVKTVREAIEHPITGAFIQNTLNHEILPYVPGDAQELRVYKEEVVNRFMNPAIEHQLATITLNSIAKFKVRLIPSIKAYLSHHHLPPEGIVLSFASLLYLYATAGAGPNVQLKDESSILEFIQGEWKKSSHTESEIHNFIQVCLAQTNWWGENLNELHGLTDRIAFYLYIITQQGILIALNKLLQHEKS